MNNHKNKSRGPVVEKKVRPAMPSSLTDHEEENVDVKVQEFLKANPLAAYTLKASRGLRRTLRAMKEPIPEAKELLAALEKFVPAQREFVQRQVEKKAGS